MRGNGQALESENVVLSLLLVMEKCLTFVYGLWENILLPLFIGNGERFCYICIWVMGKCSLLSLFRVYASEGGVVDRGLD